MTYWFFQSKGDNEQPQSLKLTYSKAKHEETRQNLIQLVTRLGEWLDRHETQGEDFPQVSETSESCSTCGFAMRCQRTALNPATELEFTNLAAIAEVPL
jgi:hypothetical protein